MPYYSAPKDKEFENVGFSYNKAIIQDLLRGKLGFKGIINSDTGPIDMMPWGVEKLTILERYQKAIGAGVDIFSGGADPALLLETVKKGLVTEARIIENPYVDVEAAVKVVGNAEFQKKADIAQRKSIVLLRNEANLLPLSKTARPASNGKTKIYFETYYDNGRTKNPIAVNKPTINNTNFEYVSTKEEADVVLLWVLPNGGSLFNSTGKAIELSLSKNKIDVAHINEIINAKPTILAINYSSPWVIDEIDKGNAKTVLATFGTTQEALIDVVSGAFNPTGKMPFTTPISEKAAAENKSDVPGFMEPKGYALFKFGDGLGYK
jgi:beta-glucosidase